MNIEIQLFASLRKHLPDADTPAAVRMEVPDDATVEQVLSMLKVPMERVKLIFVNNRRALLDKPLAAGDRVGVFPPVAGG